MLQVPQDQQQYHGCTRAANPSAGAGVDGQNYGQTNGKLWENNRRLWSYTGLQFMPVSWRCHQWRTTSWADTSGASLSQVTLSASSS